MRRKPTEGTSNRSRRCSSTLETAFRGIREIVEKILIHPRGCYQQVELETFGQPGRHPYEAAGQASESKRALVAGARFELATFRL